MTTLEQEFFIYVPTQDTVETPTDINATTCEETMHMEDGTNPIYDGWVKIPLPGEIVVYARLQEEE